MDYAQMKQEKEERYKEYCETYSEQLRLQGYIESLEKDNFHIKETEAVTNRQKRRARKLTKINNKDITKYKKILATMPALPEFK